MSEPLIEKMKKATEIADKIRDNPKEILNVIDEINKSISLVNDEHIQAEGFIQSSVLAMGIVIALEYSKGKVDAKVIETISTAIGKAYLLGVAHTLELKAESTFKEAIDKAFDD
jgi:hypothetical protein